MSEKAQLATQIGSGSAFKLPEVGTLVRVLIDVDKLVGGFIGIGEIGGRHWLNIEFKGGSRQMIPMDQVDQILWTPGEKWVSA